MEDIKIKPRVRFKKFSGNWNYHKLKDEVSFYSGLTYSPSNIVEKNGTLVLRSSNVQNGEIVKNENVYVKSDTVNSKNVEVGDVIVVVRNGSRALIGKHAQIKEKMDNTVIGAFMTGLSSKSPSFVNALLSTKHFNEEIEKNLGATINQITTGNFKEMKFYIPKEKEEKEKLGDFFIKIDELILNQQRKYDKLVNIKKSLLEKIFPNNESKEPQIRFKGFTKAWKKQKLDKIFKLKQGEQVPVERQFLNKKENYKRFIRIIDLTSKEEPPRYIKYSGTNIIKENDLFMVRYGPVGTVGIGMSGVIANNLFSLIPKIETNNYFYYHEFINMNSIISELSANTTMPAINFETLNKLELKYPNIEEQEKIATLFNSIDNLINNQQRKLEKLKNIKIALLDKMLV